MRKTIERFIKRLLLPLLNSRGESSYPREAMEALARVLYPKMIKFFENEDNMKEFEEWERQQKLLVVEQK